MKSLHSCFSKALGLAAVAVYLGASVGHASTSETQQTIELASDVWQPFTDVFGKNRFALELVSVGLMRAGYRPEMKILGDWTVPEDLKAGKYDGCGAMWHSPEREEYLLFSAPYLQNRIVLIGAKGKSVSNPDLASLKGQRLSLVEGYAYGELIQGLDGVEVIQHKNDVESIKSVIRGEADYALVDDLLLRHLAKEHGKKVENVLEVGSEPVLVRTLHMTLRKDVENAASIISAFNDQVKLMQADGTYNRVLRINAIRVDVDGDGKRELVLNSADLGSSAPVDVYDIAYQKESMEKIEDRPRYWVNGRHHDDWDPDAMSEGQLLDEFQPADNQTGLRLFELDF